jgi:diadenosine tetraphosphate (Ap4A) HIT family hydrolase
VSGDSTWKCDGSDLCAELSGSASTEFSRTYEGDPQSRILLETTNFAIVVDISPLVEGHLLVVPKKHYLNFASAMLDYRHEAVQVTQRARDWLRETYGSVALFEHGSTSGQSGGACIAHAHIHVLPVAATGLVAVMRHDELELTALLDIASWTEIAETPRPYLLCSDGERSLVTFPPARVRHQYLRCAAAEVLGIPDPQWDWSLVIRRNLLRNTVRRYRGNQRLGGVI